MYANGQIDQAAVSQGGTQYGYSQHGSSRHRREQEGVQIRYTDAAGQSSRHPDHRGRHEHRLVSRSKSRSRSRASSASLDDMLIEATTGDDGERRVDSNGQPIPQHIRHPHGQPLAAHAPQHLSPNAHSSSRGRYRSPSNERGEYLSVPQSHPRSRGSSSSHQSLHPSASLSNAVGGPAGGIPAGPGVPGNAVGHGGQVQTYQTHIFAPVVTGAPQKKSKQIFFPPRSTRTEVDSQHPPKDWSAV